MRLGHDAEFCAEKVVEEGRFTGRLRTEDGDEVVVETSLGNVFELQVVVEVGATLVRIVQSFSGRPRRLLELLILINHLDAMLEAALGWLVAHASHVAIHDAVVKIGVLYECVLAQVAEVASFVFKGAVGSGGCVSRDRPPL